MPPAIYTVGHSSHTWERFAPLLRQHGIQVLVGVRSNPVSRFAPFANSRRLPPLLDQEGVRHVAMGGSLGGKPSDRSLYDKSGAPDYGKIASTKAFRDGIEELLRLAEGSVVALMCAEEDPVRCHRQLLIGPALAESGVSLRHIRSDGSVQEAFG